MINKVKDFIINVVKSAILDIVTGKEIVHLPLEVKLIVDGKEKEFSSYIKTKKGDTTLYVSIEDEKTKEEVK